MSAMLDGREGETAGGRGGGDVYMVGNWLLSAARVVPQEPLLCAALMAAVCGAENLVHLSPQPAMAAALNTHSLSLTCTLFSRLLRCIYDAGPFLP